MISLILTVILARIFHMWIAGNPKHRFEFQELYFFFGERRFPLGIPVPRTLAHLFAIFEGQYAGFLFAGIQILFYDENKRVLAGVRKGARKSRWLLDFGVCGMIPYFLTPEQTAIEEIHEEIGAKEVNLELVEVLMPHCGYPCITYLYRTKIPCNTPLQSKDDTFEKIEWVYPATLDTWIAFECAENPNCKPFSDGATCVLREGLLQKYLF